MKTLYAINDRVAGQLVGHSMYLLFAFHTDQEATRYFADAILDDKSILAKHPADYELIKIADVNEQGEIVAEHGPAVVITGDSILALQQPKLPQA